MDRKYKIISHLSEKGTITFNPETLKVLGLDSKKILFIRFGIRVYETKLCSSSELRENEILLSNEIIEDLIIPLYGSYDLLLEGNELIIGPYIGMLTAKTEDELSKIVKSLNSYIYSYDEIGGAILAFSTGGIDENLQLIHGYCFNPEDKSWIKSTYSYPAAIFKRVWIKKELGNHFRSLLGDAIFNNYLFDKWQAYQWLSCFDGVKEYLPVTELYKTPFSLRMFLNEHESIYIKPISGSQGRGIMKLEKKDNWSFLYYNDMENKVEKCFKTNDELNQFLSSNLKESKYIIQKSLNLISTEESIIDFRLIILKNQRGEWQDIGMLGRQSVKGSIVSNVSAGGRTENGEITIKNILKLSEEEISQLRKRMSNIAISAAEALDKCGLNCGNLGVDMTIDVNGHIWIIEINNLNPNHMIAKTAGDREMFYRARLLNMLYAKGLAGFKGE
jgi:glutathione synthase/RimK-type ligase-like ATP-grasp enzyme